jgi:membrane protein implicated in regulation of membrane protease activity
LFESVKPHTIHPMGTLLYAICLTVGLLFTIISAVAGHFFGDVHGHDADVGTGGHAEAGFDHTGMPGISFFSPTVLASFVTAFGAFGLILAKIPATSSVWASAPLSAAGGGIVAWLVFLLFNAMFRATQSSSEAKIGSLTGQTATVITPIPANGVGEIAYVQGGTRYTAPARAERGQAVANGQTVKVHRIVGSQCYVQPES